MGTVGESGRDIVPRGEFNGVPSGSDAHLSDVVCALPPPPDLSSEG